MRVLELIIKEYLSIMSYLIGSEPAENNRITIDKELFQTLLEENRYLEFRQKTKAYKHLGFIIHDKNNYTLPCKDPEINKTVRRVVFNYETYLSVKKLYETELNFD